MTRLELTKVAQACADRFGPNSSAGVFLQVLEVCFSSGPEREAAVLSAYWMAGPPWIDALLCDGDIAQATQQGNASDVRRAFTKLGRCLPLPSHPVGRVIQALLKGLESYSVRSQSAGPKEQGASSC